MGGITRLNQLPDGSGILSSDDIFLMMDDPSGSAITKKVSLAALSSIISQDSITPNVQTINSASGTINTDVSLYNVFNINLASSGTLAAPSNSSDGQRSLWRVKRTNGQVLTLHNNFRIINSGTIDNSTHTTTFIDGIYDSNTNRWDSIIHNNLPAIAPTAPSGLSGNPGDSLVNLSWSAPSYNGGSSITDYIIQYSANSGVSWNTFDDGIGTSLLATVTGLVNDTGYIFRVAAQNSIDIGPYSDPSLTIRPQVTPLPTLLLHFDGANGNTTLTDSSLNNWPVAASGSMSISTTESKFGGSSGQFSGDPAIVTGNIGAFDSDFTIEGWFWLNSLSSQKTILLTSSNNNSNGWVFYIEDTNKLNFFSIINNSVVWQYYAQDYTPPTEQWVHLAFTRAGSILRWFADGVELSATIIGSNVNGSVPCGSTVGIGGIFYGTINFSGYMDEIRIINGSAVYTDNFVPPASPFPNPVP